MERVDTANQGGDIMTKGLVEAEYVPKRKMLMGWIFVAPLIEEEFAQKRKLLMGW